MASLLADGCRVAAAWRAMKESSEIRVKDRKGEARKEKLTAMPCCWTCVEVLRDAV